MYVYKNEREIEEHRESALKHSVRRAEERLQISMTESLVREQADQIRRGASSVIGNGGGGRQLHALCHENRTYYAVWCPTISMIVTYLNEPSEWKGSLNQNGHAILRRLPAQTRRAS